MTTRFVSARRVVCILLSCFAVIPWVSATADAREQVEQTRIPSRLAATLLLETGRQESGSAPASSSSSGGCPATSRSYSDRPDLESGPQVHVIYMLPQGAIDERLDIDGTLLCSIEAQNRWMVAQTKSLEWRFDSFSAQMIVDGQNTTLVLPDITFVQSARPAAQLDGGAEVRSELQLLGFTSKNKRYLTYVASGEDGGICGDAYYPYPEIHEPWSGQYAQVYLDAPDGCGSDDFGTPGAPSYSETVAQQELMHNDGMTPPGAPHNCPYTPLYVAAHVCTGPLASTEGNLNLDPERFDVMFPFAGVPLSQKSLDRDHNDYFRHDLPIPDLEGSPFFRPATAGFLLPVGATPREPAPNPSPASGAGSPSPSPSGSPSEAPSADPEEPVAEARSVSLEASRTRVRAGRLVDLGGAISGSARCIDGADVVLQARRPAESRFRPKASVLSDPSGTFAFSVRVRTTSVFRVRVEATDSCQRAVSRSIKVIARA